MELMLSHLKSAKSTIVLQKSALISVKKKTLIFMK